MSMSSKNRFIFLLILLFAFPLKSWAALAPEIVVIPDGNNFDLFVQLVDKPVDESVPKNEQVFEPYIPIVGIEFGLPLSTGDYQLDTATLEKGVAASGLTMNSHSGYSSSCSGCTADQLRVLFSPDSAAVEAGTVLKVSGVKTSATSVSASFANYEVILVDESGLSHYFRNYQFSAEGFWGADYDNDGIANENDLDDDNDGMNDVLETTYLLNSLDATDAGVSDLDNDGLTFTQELALGTEQLIPDTDYDSYIDSQDACPNDPLGHIDTDDDSVCNYADTDDDNDGLSDEYEALYSVLHVSDSLCELDSLVGNDPTSDYDDDTLSLGEEFLLNTDPCHDQRGGAFQLFSDNFNNGYVDWDYWSVRDYGTYYGDSSWGVVDGKLRQFNETAKPNIDAEDISYEATYLYYRYDYNQWTQWTDYHFSFVMNTADSETLGKSGALGAMFRYSDNDNYYRFSWVRGEDKLRLDKKVNGTFVELAVADASGYSSDVDYKVDIKVNGDHLEVYIDDAYTFYVKDDQSPSPTNGTVAMYTWKNSGAKFDSVVGWSIAGVDAVPVVKNISTTLPALEVGETADLFIDALDVEGQALTYTWHVDGLYGSLSSTSIPNPVFTPTEGLLVTYDFEVTVDVTDGTSTVRRTLPMTVAPETIPLVISAGDDFVVNEQTLVTLASTQAAGRSIVSWDWERVSGSPVEITKIDPFSATFTAPTLIESEELVFRFVAVDTVGVQATDEVSVVVMPVNAVPTANAGSNITVDEKTQFTLTGTASDSDSDGSGTSYQWTQLDSDPETVILVNATSATPTLTAPTVYSVTTLNFDLVVTDNEGGVSLADRVVVTVNPVNEALPVAVITLSGGGGC
ncbi:hypothetical protein ACFL2V_07150 [Pseudomonadota bacterium]